MTQVTTYKTNDKEKVEREVDIDKKVLGKAGNLGIDVPGIKEIVIKDIIYTPTGHLEYDIVDAQEEFLESIRATIKRPNAQYVEIGQVTKPNSPGLRHYAGGKIILYHDTLMVLNPDPRMSSSKAFSLSDIWQNLYPPAKIIENLLLVLIEAAEQNKKKIRELQVASELVKGIDSLYGAIVS